MISPPYWLRLDLYPTHLGLIHENVSRFTCSEVKKGLTNRATLGEATKAVEILKQANEIMKSHHVTDSERILRGASLNNELVLIVLQKKRQQRWSSLNEAAANSMPDGLPHPWTVDPPSSSSAVAAPKEKPKVLS